MSNSFRQAYSGLTDFIASHPEIEIGDSVISIPESVRTEFYRFFNAVRGAFVEQQFPTCLDRAGLLLEKYHRAEERVASLISFEETPIVSRLRRFIGDPKGSLTRELFDPLFDLLKGRGSIDDFEKKASASIEELFPIVYRGGYEKWAVLSLVGMLGAEKALRVNVRNLNTGERAKPAAQAPLEEIPIPQESTGFFFSQPREAIFAVPDFIIQSSPLNRFVGIRSEFKEGLHNAWNASLERKWHLIDTDLLIQLESGLTLLYVAERAESIALIADVAKFCGPDLVLWCVDTQSLTKEEALAKIALVDNRLRPPKGSYIIADDSWPESTDTPEANLQPPAGQTAGVHLLTVGYDESKLMPVVDALIDEKGPAATT